MSPPLRLVSLASRVAMAISTSGRLLLFIRGDRRQRQDRQAAGQQKRHGLLPDPDHIIPKTVVDIPIGHFFSKHARQFRPVRGRSEQDQGRFTGTWW